MRTVAFDDTWYTSLFHRMRVWLFDKPDASFPSKCYQGLNRLATPAYHPRIVWAVSYLMPEWRVQRLLLLEAFPEPHRSKLRRGISTIASPVSPTTSPLSRLRPTSGSLQLHLCTPFLVHTQSHSQKQDFQWAPGYTLMDHVAKVPNPLTNFFHLRQRNHLQRSQSDKPNPGQSVVGLSSWGMHMYCGKRGDSVL